MTKITANFEGPTGKRVKKSIKKSIEFWKNEGFDIYRRNKNKTLGDSDTQRLAKNFPYEYFVLHMLSCDLKIIIRDRKKYETGHSGGHIWLHKNGKRVFIAHF